MPKIVDYPWASLSRALNAAEAVDALGGKCSTEMCAEKMGMKVGGGFKAILSAAGKFNLIENGKGSLTVTALYKSIKYAYNEEEKLSYVKQAFLSAPIFQEIYNRFKGNRLPVEFFDRLLIREFQVEPSVASRVASYFIEGAKDVGLLDENSLIVKESNLTLPVTNETEEIEYAKTEDFEHKDEIKQNQISVSSNEVTFVTETDEFVIQIKGPGIDTKIVIKEEDDIGIVELTLNKIKKKLSL